ncbi:MAG: alpha/beta hydrolase [Candidatus Pseudothioglobus sp.]|mgnify:FL=1|tara:strand:- start:2828 stop:3685 length:858 start_codon:yes stop_codon:yes gene_type:complete
MLNISSIEKYIALSEAKIHKLRPNIEKKILWAHKADQKTPISLVFIHGFSATRAELSPVIEQVGLALKANVFFTRLTGHGQDGVELSNATFENWISDTKEAISVGELIGDEVVLIGSSTGCSLIHALIEDQVKVRSVIYISPNFGPSSFRGHFLRVPGAKWFIPLILGKEHSFVAKNSEHERCWTTHYPTEALFAVKDSVVAASLANHKNIKLPMLFWFSDNDKVVSAKDTRKIISKMGRNVEVFNPILSPNDDPSKHGVLGDILSPTKTAQGVRKIIEWIKRNN